ncbi:hypothetical protein JS533_001480 [Bifidobacterium amazonense]|uniref:DUF6199 domain-containing protein n=1 Tax=Bifidobacterium amazonense TaxID=2809027 RepID=A0ABS9VS89_9BIFI|nr:DUF6199 family natural product biosynthesis protein [Bifidobacterium amazonense]MCH9274960.1 hypothetical protein [Bifidobacterium amazonense]
MTAVYIILAIFTLAFGILSIIAPEAMWKIEHCLDVRGGEPTKYYLIMQRIFGVFTVIVCIAAIGVLLFGGDDGQIDPADLGNSNTTACTGDGCQSM